jgi:hypothetical protein
MIDRQAPGEGAAARDARTGRAGSAPLGRGLQRVCERLE